MNSVIKLAAAMLLLAVAGKGAAEHPTVPVPDEVAYQMAIQAFGVSEQAAKAAARQAAEEAAQRAGEESYWSPLDEKAGVILSDNPYGVE